MKTAIQNDTKFKFILLTGENTYGIFEEQKVDFVVLLDL